ncbi:MAG: hypothetical protein EOP06_27665 [Proteobacteria bacterium]|nr:MAG: hypothetical protein EOP06_27665 [Pseudomonadota bacterium]
MNEEPTSAPQDQADNCLLSIEVFDGHSFERFTVPQTKTGIPCCCYAVDGIEVSQEHWIQQRQRALIQDMVTLGIQLPVPKD